MLDWAPGTDPYALDQMSDRKLEILMIDAVILQNQSFIDMIQGEMDRRANPKPECCCETCPNRGRRC